MTTVLDVITREQLTALRDIGFVIVHRAPTETMLRAAVRNEWPEDHGPADIYHRMIGESIRLQNIDIAQTGQ